VNNILKNNKKNKQKKVNKGSIICIHVK